MITCPSNSPASSLNEPTIGRPEIRRRFRSFRVRYSDVNVSTSVGHVCLFGNKRLETGEALRRGTSVISFATLYGLAMCVAYNLRHAGVRAGDTAYLDAAESCRGLVGLLGSLRAGCTVVVPKTLLPASERDDILKQECCRIVLTDRLGSVAPGDEREVVNLLEVEPLSLPKELDWQMPRPAPDQIAIIVLEPKTDKPESDMIRQSFQNHDLARYLQGDASGLRTGDMGRIPYHDDLIRLARVKSLPMNHTFGTTVLAPDG